MSRYRRWPWALVVVLAGLAAAGCNGGPGVAGTPGNGAQPPATGSAAGGATPSANGGATTGGGSGSGNSGGGNSGSGNSGGNSGGGHAAGAPINIPQFLLNEAGTHTPEQGKQDAINYLNGPCGPSLCGISIVTAGDPTTCISHIDVSPRGGVSQDPSNQGGVTVYPGDTITISGGSPCPGSSDQSPPADTSSP
jgi:hypothetical protein